MRAYVVLVCWAGLGPWGSSCVAQDLRYLSQQAWSTEQGLPQSSVHAIAQTKDGYLWVATEGGLARFDGVGFKIFDRSTNAAFTSDDLCCLEAEANGGLLVGTADGVVEIQGGIARPLREGRLNTGNALRVVGGASWGYDRTSVTVVRGDVQQRWAAGRELPPGRVQTVSVDRAGTAWVGMNNGLVLLSAKTPGARPVAALGANSVLAVFEDAEGNHWIGTETTGLHVLRRLAFRSEPGLANEAVTAVAQTMDGAMWVGTREDGLRRVVGGVVDQPVNASALTSPVVLCLAPGAHGGLWVGTPDGLDFVEAGGAVRKMTSADGLPDDTIRSLAADEDGSVWAGTQHGLVHVHGAGMTTLGSAEGLSGDVIGAMLMTGRHALWVATSGGLSRVGENGDITNFGAKDGLDGRLVTAMAEDGAGDLWIATRGGGLSLFDGRRFIAAGTFGAAEAGDVEGLRTDRLGYLWLRAERGVSRVSLAALHACTSGGHCAEGMATRYGPPDGMPSAELVAGSSAVPWLAVDGEMWFATRGGVAIADTVPMSSRGLPVPVVIQRLLVDDVAQPVAARSIELGFGHERLTMEYAGLEYTSPSGVRYRVKLEGFEKDWVEVGARRSATYTNLPPGPYRFVVEATLGDGVWSAPAAELRFRIVPPFWRRWWFYVLVALLFAACLGGLYLLRLRGLRRRFDAVLVERSRMAREIHDTLTQDFVATSLQLDIIKQQLSKGKVELAIEQVRRTRQMVTDGLAEARQSIWELRANRLEETLPTRLAHLVQREVFAGLAPKLRVGGAYRPAEARVEREVVRIAQETLTNAVKHAKATAVAVEMHYSSDTLMLTIEDDGMGFARDEASKRDGHYGLLGMQERASMIDGTLQIDSEPGRGTRVTLRVPMAHGGR